MNTRDQLSDDDRRSIERLQYRYCDLVDRARVDELVDLFADDAEIDYGHGRSISGADSLARFFLDRFRAYSGTSHHLSNVMIDVDEDGAVNVQSSIYAWHQLHDGSQVEVWGRYLDVVVRCDDGWRFGTRAIRAAGWRGFTVPEGEQGPFQMIDREVVR